MGNRDLALARAARFDDGPRSDYWIDSYRARHDHEMTFRSYLGRVSSHGTDHFESELEELKKAIPEEHRPLPATVGEWRARVHLELPVRWNLYNAAAQRRLSARLTHARRQRRIERFTLHANALGLRSGGTVLDQGRLFNR